MRWLKNTVIATVMIGGAAVAQEAPQELWRDEMTALSFLAGSFEARGEAMTQEGWAAGEVTQMTAAFELGGASLVEHSNLNTPLFTSTLAITYSYDGFRDVYRIAVVDNTYGLMDIYEGSLEHGVLVATNRRSGTSFPLGDGSEMFFRMTVSASNDGHVTSFDAAVDDSDEWQPMYRITFTRISD